MSNLPLIACICEGAFEQAIMEILLDAEKLIFTREQLLEEEILRCRKAANFQRDHLNKSGINNLTVYRILDSKKEIFKLSGPYKEKVNVINIITSPEIEMLVIHAEDKFDDYAKKRIKPNEYVSKILKYKHVKSYDFAKEYFSDVDKLICAIRKYRSNSQIKENTLCDILR